MPTRDAAAPAAALDQRRLARLLEEFGGSRVTLCSRTYLDDAIVRDLGDAVCRVAGREIAIDARVVPTMDAGAVLYVGDAGRIVLDPRGMWLSSIERSLREQLRTGEMPADGDAFAWLKDRLSNGAPAAEVERLSNTGRVLRVGDGVAVVAGLRDVGAQEIVEFEGGVQGVAFTLRTDTVGVVLLGDERHVREGADVTRTGGMLKVPVGESMLGRVIDPLGRPVDGRGAIVPAAWLPVERPAPRVVDRQPVDTPLHTGIKVIDALVPIGRGQRELIIGDRKIGKTSIALDTILAQRGAGVSCVYCAIGQKASTVRELVSTLEREGALDYTAVVVALPGDVPAMRYFAPYTACALGEYFMDRGLDALVVYDDLAKHAVTYREISALLDRPVGREAYPGDVFYLHSRLLERAARLSEERGGGSLTALPIVETLSGDISAFIPTNVISICDGQIVLDEAAFNEGRRPAMDSGLSVSRVGGSAQSGVMKRIAGRLRIDLAQYEEMARFVKFGAEVDETTQRQLHSGERARELLRQPLHRPMTLEEEAAVLLAAVDGLFDDVDVAHVGAVEDEMLAWLARRTPDEMAPWRSATDDAERAAALRSLLEGFFARRSDRLADAAAPEGERAEAVEYDEAVTADAAAG